MSGYDLSDPKHPRYHSVHSDLWDNRDKVAAMEAAAERRSAVVENDSMTKHEITLVITVDESKLLGEGDSPGNVDEWSSIHDVVDAFQDGAIIEGEVTNYTAV